MSKHRRTSQSLVACLLLWPKQGPPRPAPVQSDVTWLDMGVLPGPHLDELYRDRRLSHAAAADDHQFVRLHLHFPVYFDQLASEIFIFLRD